MEKRKRFPNPATSSSQAPTSANSLPQAPTPANSLPQAPTTANSLPQAPISANSLPQNSTNSSTPIKGSSDATLNGSTPVESSSSVEIPQQSQPSRQHVSRESQTHWTVEAIDPQGATKRIKLKYWQVNELPKGERVIVHFDEQAAAYGEAQGLLAGYCGTLAINPILFPINFERWNGNMGMPKQYMDNCFETDLKPRFQFMTTEALAKRYCSLSISKKWAAHRQSLWTTFYDPSKTRDQLLSNVPKGVDPVQWTHFVNYRLNPKTQALCEKNKESRKKQVVPHTGGSKPLSRKKHELLLEEGRPPSRGKLFLATHNYKEDFENDATKAIMEQIETGLAQSNVDESEISPNDVIGRVFGPEHSGRVQCMGMGAVPANTFRSNRDRLSNLSNFSTVASTSSDTDWQAKYQSLESAFKAYIMMKEGRIPNEVANFLGSSNPTDVANEPNSPLNGRASCGGSNI